MKKKPIFEKTNLWCIVDYDYDRSPCRCNAYEYGGYCRCTTIERVWVDNVNVNEVVNELYQKYGRTDSEIDRYCFERICYAHKIYDKDLYEVEICGGYYGEEVGGVYFENEKEIYDAYNFMISFDTDIEKIRYCLKQEYGYLINSVVSATSAVITEVDTNRVLSPQTEYFVKVSKDIINEYKNRTLPVAVCIKDGNYFKLIDGYHRFVANNYRDTVSIVMIS